MSASNCRLIAGHYRTKSEFCQVTGNNCRRLTANEINITVETIAIIARLTKNKRDVCRTARSLESSAKYPNNCHFETCDRGYRVNQTSFSNRLDRSFRSFRPDLVSISFGLSQATLAIIFQIGPPSKLIYSIHSGNPAIHRLVVTSRGTTTGESVGPKSFNVYNRVTSFAERA